MQLRAAFLSFFVMMLAATVSYAQPSHPNSSHDTVSNSIVKITYGRPSMKGRKIFGGLVPYGKVWRLGADEATTITFAKDGMLGNQPVKAGTYALFAIPTEHDWTFILNSQPKQWGLDHDKNKDKDLVQPKGMSYPLQKPVEKFTIGVTVNAISFEWEKTKVVLPIK